MEIIPFSSIFELPANSKMLLYGCGGRGHRVLNLIINFRSDIEILGFVDSFTNGKIGEYTVYSLSQLQDVLFDNNNAHIILSSTYANEIYCSLMNFNIDRLYVPNPFLVGGPKGSFWSKEETDVFSSNIDSILPMFHRDLDKKFLCNVINLLRPAAECMQSYNNLMDFNVNLSEQYFDYINKSEVHMAIDGGMENGYTSLRFMHHFPGVEIHGFEPFPAAMLLSPIYCYLINKDQLKINYLGLSDECKNAVLNINPKAFSANNILDGQNGEYTTRVQTTTLDEYCRINSIGRVDFVKLDIEAYELKALSGASKIIKRDRPQMAVCIYHRRNHYYEIPILLNKLCDDYNFYLGFYGLETFLETVVYAIPREIDSND